MIEGDRLLEVRNLAVHYHGRRRGSVIKALDGIDLNLEAGTAIGVVGESGSGKSTLAKAILGLAPIHSGSIRLDGKDITNLKQKSRREFSRILQVVFQDPSSSLNPYITVGTTIEEPLRVHGINNREELNQRIAKALDQVGLSPDVVSRYPGQFSGGQKQRIAIARALIINPQLIICDEVVSALDLSIQAQILNLLSDLQKRFQLSYLFISHDIAVIRYISNQVIVLYQGRVMESGSTAVVTIKPSHPYTRELIASSPITNPRAQRKHRDERQWERPTSVTSYTEEFNENGCPFAPRCQFAKDVCTAERPPLKVTVEGGLTACHRYPEWQTLQTTPFKTLSDNK
jgi:oligopeptide/dipeptide ABC transporter ATP-binding protein